MKIKDSKAVLFPIDTVSRELEWQLLLSCKLSMYGYNSVIGHKQFIREIHKSSNNCIWFGRLGQNEGLGSNDIDTVNIGKDNGTLFYYLHDEGGFYNNKDYDSSVKRINAYEHTWRHKDFKICTWGRYQKDVLKELVHSPENQIITTGMPRFDLYLKEFDWLDMNEVKSIKSNYGNFILITTKFGTANTSERISGLVRINKLIKKSYNLDSTEVQTIFDKWKKDNKDFTELANLIHEISVKNQSKNFVVRPHPSENLLFYKEVFKYYPNVKVIREGDVRAWIKGCDQMIHSGCTTGFEGVIAGKKVINFLPKEHVDSPYNIAIAEESGILATNPNEVNDILNKNNTSDNDRFSESAQSKLLNINEKSIDAILSLFEREVDSSPSIISTNLPLKAKYRLFRHRVNLKKEKRQTKGMSGRVTRLSDLPKSTIRKMVKSYNQEYNTDIEIKELSNTYCVIGKS